MRQEKLEIAVSEELANGGYQYKITAGEHIHDLQSEIERQYCRGLFDEEFYREELTGFDFKATNGFAGTTSLIVVAAPQSRVQVTFNWQGASYCAIIPPTYSYATDKQIQNVLEKHLNPAGYHLKKARLPWKLLAVHSGLAQYGKNNITYVAGMGSYHRLVAFVTDFPAMEDHWHAPQVLESCENCKACLKACPSAAIAPDRFLINGARCLTFHNERRGEFPQWISPSWHNCLVGCLSCQKVCPVNKDKAGPVREGPVFSEKETAFILRDRPRDEISQQAIQKLESLDMIEYLPVLGRNLKALHSQLGT